MVEHGKWITIKRLGEGGQGIVYLAVDSSRIDSVQGNSTEDILNDGLRLCLDRAFREQPNFADSLRKCLLNYHKIEKGSLFGALKELHIDKEDAEFKKAVERAKREITALRAIEHPHIVPILDEKIEERWFVMSFFSKGPLSSYLHKFRGNFAETLKAFRKVVDAVAHLHEKGIIHRDIKPDNIFLDDWGNLVLGDLGLVFFMNDKRMRLTSPLENVGSRDWMPAWAMGQRVEELQPSFDVFSLGKVLWSLLSGNLGLTLWYHRKPQFDLERIFPNSPELRWANLILDNCVVEEEKDCLKDAGELLQLVDDYLFALNRGANLVRKEDVRQCRVCGRGKYLMVVDQHRGGIESFGLNPNSHMSFKIFACSNCGHTDLFSFHQNRKLPLWE